MSSCGCGSGCSCSANNCSCKRSELSYLENPKPFVLGVAPIKEKFEELEMGVAGAEEHGCKCGDNCKCDPCNC